MTTDPDEKRPGTRNLWIAYGGDPEEYGRMVAECLKVARHVKRSRTTYHFGASPNSSPMGVRMTDSDTEKTGRGRTYNDVFCEGCGHKFSIRERMNSDHVVRFPDGLSGSKNSRERYCSPECFTENYATDSDTP